MPCTNDLAPIILAIAAVIAIQTPILVAAFVVWLKRSPRPAPPANQVPLPPPSKGQQQYPDNHNDND